MIKKNKGIIKVRKLRSYKSIDGTDYLIGLCGGFYTVYQNELWDEYWKSINTKNKLYVTDYFYFEEVSFDTIYLLRLLVLKDFCNQYDYELKY